MAGITFSGLVSGLDTGSLIDKLVAVERASANALVKKQSQLTSQKTIVGSLSTALAALGTATRAMDLDPEVRPNSVTVTDARVAVAVSSSATAGVHDLRVKALAASKVVQSKTFASTGPGIVGNGGVDITVAGVTKSVAWDSTDTLDSIAQKINNADAGVTASVLNVDGTNLRIIVTAKQSGTAAAPTFADTGPGANRLDFDDAANQRVAAANAVIGINGIDVTRPTNVIADALPGVTLTLNSLHLTGEANAKATVALDAKALTDKVKAIVTAYNTVNTALHAQLDYTGTPKGADTLFGDSTLRQLRTSLDATLGNAYGSSNLAAIGLSRDKTGAMTLDETKLAAAVAADRDAVSKIFVTGGFASAVGSLADQYTKGGGMFAAKTDSLTSRHTALQQQIDRIERAADALQARLEKQFGALEQAMSQLQSQAGYLTSMLNK